MINEFIKYIENKNDEFIIFDIGSRDCIQSIEFYNTFPNAKIYAFECNPNTINICKNNIKLYNDRIILIEGAVSNYDGDIIFYPINQQKTITSWSDGNPGASSIYKSNNTYIYETYIQDEISINCHRLDSVMKKYNIPKVDIIWIDLQGAELLAFKSLGNHLENVKYIHTEISHKEIYSGQVMFNELNDFIISNGFIIKNNLLLQGWQEDVIYENNLLINHIQNNIFDIVICVGPKDKDIIYQQIEYIKINIIGYKKIYLISYDPNIIVKDCITINENIFPFSLDTISFFHGKLNRNNWYLQQLLKLYAGKFIPGILEKYLVIDADTFFLKPTTFIENNKCLYNFGTEYHKPYFDHMLLLDKNLIKVDNTKSGICHHMIFETIYINELFNKIEKNHNDKFYNVFLKLVSEFEFTSSGASEYEIYFNYMLKNHNDKIKIRQLNWDNVNFLDINSKLDYISYNWYDR
jgi:FkbM family methyltransferase